MKILVDMNLSPKWTNFLIEHGIDAVHWSSIGAPNSPDTDIIAYARLQDCTIFTNDPDFGFILAITQGKNPA